MSVVHKLRSKARNIKETCRRTKYARYYKQLNINKNIILYDSYFGRGLICNPYAIFLELVNNEEFKDFTHVWVLEDDVESKPILDAFAGNKHVITVSRHSNNHLKYLASAGYIITNVSLPFYYCKKEGQVYVNTWHGTPVKSLGYDVPGAATTISNVLRNFLSTDYIISSSPFLTSIFLEKHKLQGLYNGKIIEEGYPRNDRLFNANKDDVVSIFKKYNISIDPSKKIILYAPTWKGCDYYHPQVDVDEYINFKKTLENNLNTTEYQILIKPHQVVYKELLKSGRLDDTLIPACIDTNELLSITDILISDYSSIFYDFVASGKPVIFYIPDLAEYREYRGLYMNPEELPGPALTSVENVADSINNLDKTINNYQSKYAHARKFACPYDDGLVTKRLVDIIFRNKTEDESGRKYNIITCDNSLKKKILFFGGGMLTNGISTALRTMLDVIDYDRYDVTVYAGNLKYAESKEMICTLNPKARVFSRISFTPATFTEQIRNNLLRIFGFNFPFMKSVYPKKMFDREFVRCFGNSKFDTVIDYSGYGSFYSILLLSARNAKKLIWQHNDLYTDKNKVVNHKKPHSRELRVVFSAYQFYDKIVGCSQSTMEINLKKIGYKRLEEKCCFVRNTANFSRVIEGSKESYTIETAKEAGLSELFDPTLTSFVNMGRLSPEKNQMALIKAFSRLYKDNNNLRLYIIGDGPLYNELKSLISSLKLEGKVILTGNLDNPFMLMKECDCFVLPSLHEGQPVSILEARLLKLPIIMSNFDSAPSSIIENGQLVIGNSVNDIYDGLVKFINGKVPTCEFNHEEYNQATIEQFEEIV